MLTLVQKDVVAKTRHFWLLFADKDIVYLSIQVLCTKIKMRDIRGVRQLWLYCLFRNMFASAARLDACGTP